MKINSIHLLQSGPQASVSPYSVLYTLLPSPLCCLCGKCLGAIFYLFTFVLAVYQCAVLFLGQCFPQETDSSTPFQLQPPAWVFNNITLQSSKADTGFPRLTHLNPLPVSSLGYQFAISLLLCQSCEKKVPIGLQSVCVCPSLFSCP